MARKHETASTARPIDTIAVCPKAELYKGKVERIGLAPHGDGYNFSVHAGDPNITSVTLVKHDPANPDVILETHELSPVDYDNDNFKLYGGYFDGNLRPGDVYSLTVNYEPGHVNKEVFEPYARQVRNYERGVDGKPRFLAVVPPITPIYDRPSNPAVKGRIIYETHIVDQTKQNSDIPEDIRGTYEGFAHPANIKRLLELGVTTVNIMPIHFGVPDPHLWNMDDGKGRLNHWGYNSMGFFAPNPNYAHNKDNPTQEFKDMVDALHSAGIEVILDVVYNHTAEGGQGGPTYGEKALDNDSYYHLESDGSYANHTGCGNTLDASNDITRQMILDSMRYAVEELGVDGFRFDLLLSLLRKKDGEIDRSFLDEIMNDEVLRGCFLTGEPWDLGRPPLPHDFNLSPVQPWSDHFRDTARDFFNWGAGTIGDLADLISAIGQVNFITAHDGFTLRDLVSYLQKKNDENGEKNKDGADNNRSHDHGVDGSTDNPDINKARQRTMGNFALLLLVAEGIPMISHGDEILHTKHGNNNSYNLSTDRNWLKDPNDLTIDEKSVFNFFKTAIWARKSGSIGMRNPVYTWLKYNGENIPEGDSYWDSRDNVLGVYRPGAGNPNEEVSGTLYYVNGSDQDKEVTLPVSIGKDLLAVVETASGRAEIGGLGILTAGQKFTLPAKSSLFLLEVPKSDQGEKQAREDAEQRKIGGVALRSDALGGNFLNPTNQSTTLALAA